MLVLSRKPEERITIGDDITIVVIGIKNGEVRLGIEAPREIPIIRDDANRTSPRHSNPPSND